MDLEATVRELVPKLFGYCALRTGDRALAEDVAQEALTALVQRWRRHGPPDSPPAFVFAIARRRCARALLRRRLWLPLDGFRGHPADGGDPEQALVDKSERARIVAALDALRDRDRDLLLLLAAGDVRVDEAAALLRISPSAVKMRASRARQQLRHLLESEDGTRRPERR